MKYKIGELITQKIDMLGIPYRRYALQNNFSEITLTAIRSGNRPASAETLNKVIDIEELREPLLNDLNNVLNDVPTDTLIKVYNIIYAKLRDN